MYKRQEPACADHRSFGKEADLDKLTVPVCTAAYRAPDVLLGNCNFGRDLDVWSLGCVAAELFLRRPLFRADQVDGSGKGSQRQIELLILDAQFRVLGAPPPESRPEKWMTVAILRIVLRDRRQPT